MQFYNFIGMGGLECAAAAGKRKPVFAGDTLFYFIFQWKRLVGNALFADPAGSFADSFRLIAENPLAVVYSSGIAACPACRDGSACLVCEFPRSGVERISVEIVASDKNFIC